MEAKIINKKETKERSERQGIMRERKWGGGGIMSKRKRLQRGAKARNIS